MQYGYKISAFASSQRFFEAEKFLDKYLKGYEKEGAVFSEDGSRSQKWVKSGDEKELSVELVKNVTESAVLVFSDTPIKLFRFGGAFFYLRDIIPMAAFAALYWVLYPKLAMKMPVNLGGSAPAYWGSILLFMLISAFVMLIMILVSDKFLSARREPFRTRFIQFGGVFSAVLGVYELISTVNSSINHSLKAFSVSYQYFFSRLIMRPLSLLLILFAVLRLIKGRGRR